jgi:sugar-specific transcriptional regulator TrmB/DNA-binding CsgD family transcriptional regulator
MDQGLAEEPPMLAAAGLTELEERAYVTLLSRRVSRPDLLAERLGVTVEELTPAITSLIGSGLVGNGQAGLFAAPPDVAVEALLLRRAAELQEVRLRISGLVDAYRTGQPVRRSHDFVEILGNAAEVQRCFEDLQRAAEHELAGFCRSPFVVPHEENDTELEMLARGIRYRSVYELAVLEAPGAVAHVTSFVAAGEQARVIGRVPMKLCIIDRRYALIPVTISGPDNQTTGLLVQESSLLEALVALFEEIWEKSTPLRFTAEGAGVPMGLSPEDVRLLSLLLSGMPDKAVASQLGTSLRTVQRLFRELMDATATHTRMQLRWHMARNGWL